MIKHVATMSFLRLSNRFINKSFIQSVHIMPDKYTIHLRSTGLDGFILFGYGTIQSNNHIIHVEKDTHDFEVVRKWIDQYTPVKSS